MFIDPGTEIGFPVGSYRHTFWVDINLCACGYIFRFMDALLELSQQKEMARQRAEEERRKREALRRCQWRGKKIQQIVKVFVHSKLFFQNDVDE